jgi:hypothetical protein
MYRLFVTPPHPAPRARRVTWVLAVLTLAVGVISLAFVALRHTARGVPVATLPQPASEITAPGGPGSSAGGTLASAAGDLRASPASAWAADPATATRQGFDLTAALFVSLRPGDCLAWMTPAVPAAHPAPERVDCARPHVDEVTRKVDLSRRYRSWPGEEPLRVAAADACIGSVRAYAGALDVAPHRIVGSVWPDLTSWERGVRGVACTIRSEDLAQHPGRFVPPGAVAS